MPLLADISVPGSRRNAGVPGVHISTTLVLRSANASSKVAPGRINTVATEVPSRTRRFYHHLTFYGCMLCFAATSVATLYHYLFGWAAPYDLPSLPKLLGAVGGIALMAGTAGLWWLNRRRDPAHGDLKQKPMDLGFIALLFLTSASGLALWLARGTPAMALMLCLHLGAVMALFATLPYGKFAHGIFRSAALLRHAVEKRLPNPIGLGAD